MSRPFGNISEVGPDPVLVRAHERVHPTLRLWLLDYDINEGTPFESRLRREFLRDTEHRLDALAGCLRTLEVFLNQYSSQFGLAFKRSKCQSLLRREVVVERHARNACPVGHLVDADIRQTTVIEEFGCGIDQSITRGLSRCHLAAFRIGMLVYLLSKQVYVKEA